MKILFLTDNFPPEVNAPAIRTFEHCREWVLQGHEVTVLTCAPNFPKGKLFEGYKNKLSQTELIDGIKVIRVWSYMSANTGTIKRIIDYLSYAWMAFWRGLFLKTDVIIGTSPQFFTINAAYLLSVCKRKKWFLEVRDLWPESIKAVGAIKNKKAIQILETVELFLYRKATRIIVVTDSFKKNIVDRGILETKIDIIKNGILKEKFKTKSENKNLKEALGIPEDKIVVGYVGTHGLSHRLDFIIRSAVYFKEKYVFLFIGDGADKESLVNLKQSIAAENVLMLDSLSQKEILPYLQILTISLVNLKKSDTFKTVIPSKIFEAAACRKPILLGVEGEAKELINTYQAGLAFEPENLEDFIRQLNRLSTDQKLYDNCQKGCDQLVEDFDRRKLASTMLDIIKKENHAK